MKKRALAFTAAIVSGASPATTHDFSCRNEAAEIRCGGGECQVETEGFTPMQLTRVGPVITLCAYSACWEGRIGFSRSRSGVQFLQGRIQRAESAGGAEESILSIMISRRDQTAQINWNGFFSVLRCG
jgi:hypothetical protein